MISLTDTIAFLGLIFAIFTFVFTIVLDHFRNRVKGPKIYFTYSYITDISNENKGPKGVNNGPHTSIGIILNSINGGDRPGHLFITKSTIKIMYDNKLYELECNMLYEHPFQVSELAKKRIGDFVIQGINMDDVIGRELILHGFYYNHNGNRHSLDESIPLQTKYGE